MACVNAVLSSSVSKKTEVAKDAAKVNFCVVPCVISMAVKLSPAGEKGYKVILLLFKI